jgi:hypothetical protein
MRGGWRIQAGRAQLAPAITLRHLPATMTGRVMGEERLLGSIPMQSGGDGRSPLIFQLMSLCHS